MLQSGEASRRRSHIGRCMGFGRSVHEWGKVDIPDKNGFSPIHMAVKVNSFECVMALINMKANVNAVTLTGVTPLFLAQSLASKEIQQALIDEGGLVAVVNHDEVPPMEFLEVGQASDQSLLDFIDRDGKVPSRYTQS